MCTHRHPDLWEYEWISASFSSAPAQAPEPDPANRQWDHPPGAVLRKHSSGVKLCLPPFREKHCLYFIFFRSSCFACCLEVRSLCFTRGSVAPGSLCHPWERECVFIGRMLCPYDPRVNPAVICAIKVLTSVWRGKLFVFTACLVGVRWLKADFPFTRFPHHERGKHMLWCHIVCLIPIKCSISMQSRQRLTVCAIAILSMGSLSLTHSDFLNS